MRADDSYCIYQNKENAEIDKILNKGFGNIYDGFGDNKLSLRFGEDKTKSILFASKRRANNICELNIWHTKLTIKQQAQVTYLGQVVLDESISGEPTSIKMLYTK